MSSSNALITAQLLTKNNEATLERCLRSLTGFQILVVDLGSQDATCQIASNYSDQVLKRADIGDLAALRNQATQMTTTDWQMYLEPWEWLENVLPMLGEASCYALSVLEGDVLSKETRLWRKSAGIAFERPVFEGLDQQGQALECFIHSEPSAQVALDQLQRVQAWKARQPLLAEVDYYLASAQLSVGNYAGFEEAAQRYLLYQNNAEEPSVWLMHYYLALTALRGRRFEEALRQTIYCLAERPTYAECWCLLGDIFYVLKQRQRAKIFYENAIFFGQRRLQDDLPMEIRKYKVYPKKMLVEIAKGTL